jgi:hypothetical protein
MLIIIIKKQTRLNPPSLQMKMKKVFSFQVFSRLLKEYETSQTVYQLEYVFSFLALMQIYV